MFGCHVSLLFLHQPLPTPEAESMARSRLIPTQATPIPSPSGTPPPAALKSAAKASFDISSKSTVNKSLPSISRKIKPAVVSNGFVALPVALDTGVPGLDVITQHLYLRRKAETSVAEPSTSSGGTEQEYSMTASRTVFAVNLPHGSTEQDVKSCFEALVKARAAVLLSSEKAKGKAKETNLDFSVEAVEFVHPTVNAYARNETSLLSSECISLPDTLTQLSGFDDLKDGEGATSKKSKTAPKQAASTQETKQPTSIHPLLVSSDVTTEQAKQHLFPSASTIKAHVVMSSNRAVSILLNERASWSITTWSTTRRQDKHTRDRILYDLSRPSLDSAQLHADDWMKRFDLEHSPAHANSALAQDEAPKSKRAQAREAAAKAEKLAELQKRKAIKRRRLYDDDYAEPEADADGWVTVAAGGGRGRSAQDTTGDGEIEDDEEVREAQLEGFASGKRSIGVAKREFVKDQETQIKEERRRQMAMLNAKLGISTEEDDAALANANSGIPQEDEDDSRGGGRGRKKKMKKSRGIEMNMYGFQRRHDSKQGKCMDF